MFKYSVLCLNIISIWHLHSTLISWGQKGWPDLRNVCLVGHNVGPITEQRSGLGGGRVLIIGRIGSCKLSSFVSNSSVLRCLPGFLSFLRNHIHLTSPWDFSVGCTVRERASLYNWSMINMIKYSHRWQYREDVPLCPQNTDCVFHEKSQGRSLV